MWFHVSTDGSSPYTRTCKEKFAKEGDVDDPLRLEHKMAWKSCKYQPTNEENSNPFFKLCWRVYI